MAFQPDKVKTKAGADEGHTEMARKLRKGLVSRGKVTKGWRESKWAHEFRLLEKAVPRAEIERTLDWYCTVEWDDHTPQAWSAAAFRTKYAQIDAARIRHQKRTEVLTISPDAERLAEQVEHLHWPSGLEDKLPEAAEQSLVNFRAFCKRADAYRKAFPPRVPVPGKKNQVMSSSIGVAAELVYQWLDQYTAASFVSWWLHQTWERINGWEEINPSPKHLIWTPTHKRMGELAAAHVDGWQDYASKVLALEDGQ